MRSCVETCVRGTTSLGVGDDLDTFRRIVVFFDSTEEAKASSPWSCWLGVTSTPVVCVCRTIGSLGLWVDLLRPGVFACVKAACESS